MSKNNFSPASLNVDALANLNRIIDEHNSDENNQVCQFKTEKGREFESLFKMYSHAYQLFNWGTSGDYTLALLKMLEAYVLESGDGVFDKSDGADNELPDKIIINAQNVRDSFFHIKGLVEFLNKMEYRVDALQRAANM